jgi:hypothetical protein
LITLPSSFFCSLMPRVPLQVCGVIPAEGKIRRNLAVHARARG